MPLEGKQVILREERAEDMAFLVALRNDAATQAWGKALPPDYTEEMYLKRFHAREFSFDRTDGRFVIVHKETDERIGTISYSDLAPRLSVVIGMMVAKPFWGTGAALDAQETLLKFLFIELGVRVVRLWTHSGNPRAIGLAEKSGFRVSMRGREAIFKGGELLDNVGMDILREEYFALHPELTDNLPKVAKGQ